MSLNNVNIVFKIKEKFYFDFQTYEKLHLQRKKLKLNILFGGADVILMLTRRYILYSPFYVEDLCFF